MPAEITPAPKLLISARDAARALSICEKSLWSMTAPRGPIPVVHIGRSVRYSVDALREYIASAQSDGRAAR